MITRRGPRSWACRSNKAALRRSCSDPRSPLCETTGLSPRTVGADALAPQQAHSSVAQTAMVVIQVMGGRFDMSGKLSKTGERYASVKSEGDQTNSIGLRSPGCPGDRKGLR